MTGDTQDTFGRIKALLPRWFSDSTPVLDSLLRGYAYCASLVFALITYAALQTRIKTATDGWLDMIAADFFGSSLMRKSNQSDTSFRGRIVVNLFRERATRNAVIKVLTDLTGRAPIVIEPMRPLDTGGYGFGCGYGMAGSYGSMLLPYQAFVTAFRPVSTGIPLVAGYGASSGGYGTPSSAEYASSNMAIDAISDADIYAAVDSVKPVGTMLWTQVSS
jgi:hypothetical protein